MKRAGNGAAEKIYCGPFTRMTLREGLFEKSPSWSKSGGR